MKRFHVHPSVPDLAASIRFPSGRFGVAPTVEKPDAASRDRAMASPTRSCRG
jgi:hypothetical protein